MQVDRQCRCPKWPGNAGCQSDMTAEDLLCDICRDGCARMALASNEQGWKIIAAHVKPVEIEIAGVTRGLFEVSADT